MFATARVFPALVAIKENTDTRWKCPQEGETTRSLLACSPPRSWLRTSQLMVIGLDDRIVTITFEPDGGESVQLGMGIVFHGTAASRHPPWAGQVRTLAPSCGIQAALASVP